MKEMVGGCCVCSDDRGWPENPLVYCDGQSCTVAVHQACYGIVTVPTGPWFCRKCESQDRATKVKCELCPSKYGALKRTDNQHWAHVVCALYIPEVRFGNVTTMEPIQLQLIPAERFNKVCYICEDRGKHKYSSVGACMQCNKSGCKQQFHVTCGQTLGLLCEEAGNYLDNVKYCGYCQHHFSKVKKGGNVKTIPPYKPVVNSDSDSEKEAETASTSSKSASQSSTKRKSNSGSKSTSSRSSSSASKSSSSNQKTVHSSSKSSEKPKVVSRTKPEEVVAILPTTADQPAPEEVKLEKSSAKDIKSEISAEPEPKPDKDTSSKNTKKRKVNSRTPTPITVVSSENISVVISASSIIPEGTATTVNLSEKKDFTQLESLEKSKKVKVDTATPNQVSPAIPTPPPSVKSASPGLSTPAETSVVTSTIPVSLPTTTSSPTVHTGHHSLVVSVPLHNTTLSPSANNTSTSQGSGNVTSPPAYAHLPQEDLSNFTGLSSMIANASSAATTTPSTTMISSELAGGGLKITYEKQQPTMNNSLLQVELERLTPQEAPVKRSRSQSGDVRPERGTRNKKRSSNGVQNQHSSSSMPTPSTITTGPKRSKRLESPPPQMPSTSFGSVTQPQIKDSPPSSPSDESMTSVTMTRKGKGRKSAPASVSSSSSSTKDTKDIKLFENGVHAPHMLGNQLNLNSNMAQKMSDHLSSELEAHSIFNPSDISSNLVGPQLQSRTLQMARSNSVGSNSASGSGLSSMMGGNGNIPQTLEQLLERQWEQGSQFLMEQAQHFDIASLLSCLHQLQAENLRLEEQVSRLVSRRDQLLAVNARLALPLVSTTQPSHSHPSHPHTVNNVHPSIATNHGEGSRSRHSSYSSHGNAPTPQMNSGVIENGLPLDSNQVYPHQHRSPATSQAQPSPNVRW